MSHVLVPDKLPNQMEALDETGIRVNLNLFAVSVSCRWSESGTTNVQEEITKLEQEAAQAFVKDGVAALDKYEADDILSIDPMGVVTDKSQDKQAFSSGEVKLQSIDEMFEPRCAAGDREVPGTLMMFLLDWSKNHMLSSDKQRRELPQRQGGH